MAFIAQHNGKILDATKMSEEEIEQLQAAQTTITLLECGHDAYIRKGPGNPHFYHAHGVQCDVPEQRNIHQWMVQDVIVKEAERIGWDAQIDVAVDAEDNLYADVLCSKGDSKVAFNTRWNKNDPRDFGMISERFFDKGIELFWLTQCDLDPQSSVDMFEDLEIDPVRKEVWVEGYPLDILVEDQLKLATNDPVEIEREAKPRSYDAEKEDPEEELACNNPLFTVEDYREWEEKERALLENPDRPVVVKEERFVQFGKIPLKDYFMLYKKPCTRCNRPMLIWGLEPEYERLNWKDNLRSTRLRDYVARAVEKWVEDGDGTPEVAGVGWKTIGPEGEYQWSFVCPNWSCNRGQVSSNLTNQSKRYAIIPTPPMLDMDKRQY